MQTGMITALIVDLTVPHITPTSTPLVPVAQASPEIVLFVGLPALGKSSFYQEHFNTPEYAHVNQDTLKTRQKCVKAVEDFIRSGQSCVVGAQFCLPLSPVKARTDDHR